MSAVWSFAYRIEENADNPSSDEKSASSVIGLQPFQPVVSNDSKEMIALAKSQIYPRARSSCPKSSWHYCTTWLGTVMKNSTVQPEDKGPPGPGIMALERFGRHSALVALSF